MFFLQTRSPRHHVFLIRLSAGSLKTSKCNKRVGSTAAIVGHSSRPGAARSGTELARLDWSHYLLVMCQAGPHAEISV
jgi:hypothetical protein